jgi:hypothetical protein
MWSSLERFATPAAVLAEWQQALGADFANFQPFLPSTDEHALDYPCTKRPSCGCRHEIVPALMLAACRCEPRDSASIKLEPTNVLVYALNARKFCGAIRDTLGFDAPPDGNGPVDGAMHTWPVGIHRETQSPVYLSIRQAEGDFISELGGVLRGPRAFSSATGPARRDAGGVRND